MKKSFLGFIVVLGLSFSANAQNAATKFIQKHNKAAQELSNQFGIPAAIILSVAMHESANGTSRNAKELNNFFGVKGSNNLTHRKSMYKAFDDAKHSFESFCGMLARKNFYSGLKGNMNPAKWIKAMADANYAEAKNEWKTKVSSIIKSQNLTLYDKDNKL